MRSSSWGDSEVLAFRSLSRPFLFDRSDHSAPYRSTSPTPPCSAAPFFLRSECPGAAPLPVYETIRRSTTRSLLAEASRKLRCTARCSAASESIVIASLLSSTNCILSGLIW